MGKFFYTSWGSSPTQHRDKFHKKNPVFHSILRPIQPLNGEVNVFGDFFQHTPPKKRKSISNGINKKVKIITKQVDKKEILQRKEEVASTTAERKFQNFQSKIGACVLYFLK